METSNTTKPKRPNPIGLRFSKEFRATIEKIAAEEGRTLANTVVYIVNQYLSTTNGRLLKNIKIVPSEECQ